MKRRKPKSAKARFNIAKGLKEYYSKNSKKVNTAILLGAGAYGAHRALKVTKGVRTEIDSQVSNLVGKEAQIKIDSLKQDLKSKLSNMKDAPEKALELTKDYEKKGKQIFQNAEKTRKASRVATAGLTAGAGAVNMLIPTAIGLSAAGAIGSRLSNRKKNEVYKSRKSSKKTKR